MYKALDIRNNTEIVIIDPKWLRAINQLREFDRQDFLVCQGCGQPVRLRAGDRRREHFAHKHLENCDYAEGSAILHNSRAVLYEWLVGKFGDKVTVEKKIDGTDLFRPVDCWVEKDSVVFAYWIFDSTLKPKKRMDLQLIQEKPRIHFNWIFTANLLHVEPDHPDRIALSTNEREFIRDSKYDTVYAKGRLTTKGSLHYLDAENRKLSTFRSLSLYHGPQIYKGYFLSSDLKDVLVSPHQGEFVHRGEYEKLQEYQKQLKVNGELPCRKWGSSIFQREKDLHKTPVASFSPFVIGKCEFCGEMTSDWWSYDGKTGICKCKACLKQGKS